MRNLPYKPIDRTEYLISPDLSLRKQHTAVLTTGSPQETASTIAIQNASVSDVLRKMCPWISTSLTLLCSTLPSNVTRSCKRCCSLSSSNINLC